MKRLNVFLFMLISIIFSQTAFANSAFNIYEAAAHFLGIPQMYEPLLGSMLVLVLCLILGFYFKQNVDKALSNNDIKPSGKFTLFAFLESILDFVYSLSKEQCGKKYKSFLPILAGLFVFILVANLSGLIPGFPPPTENFSANLAIGAIVFLIYNFAGFKEHGPGYIKHFMGPFLILAPLFLVLETISHFARPLSLAFRLTANIFGDHLLLSVFSNMVPIGVPALLLCFGLLVAFIQSFVFTVLTGIYIGMAISHDH